MDTEGRSLLIAMVSMPRSLTLSLLVVVTFLPDGHFDGPLE